jgi:hypothetical protein
MDDYELDQVSRASARGLVAIRRDGEVFQGVAPLELAIGSMSLQGVAQRPFRPRGVMLWDVPERARVHIFRGTDLQGLISFGQIPARWFMQWKSFAEIVRDLDAGKEPPAWGTWDTFAPGVMLRLLFDQPVPDAQGIVWGETIR